MMCMIYCVYKLNKQGDDIQPWHTAFPILNQSVVSCPVLIIASWPQVKKVPLVAQMVKNSPTMQDTWVWSLAWEVTLKKGMATHSSILTLRIPQTQEPGGLHKEWETTEWLTLCFLVNLNWRMPPLGSPVAPSAPHGAAAAHSHSLTHFHHWLLTQSIPLYECALFCFGGHFASFQFGVIINSAAGNIISYVFQLTNTKSIFRACCLGQRACPHSPSPHHVKCFHTTLPSKVNEKGVLW